MPQQDKLLSTKSVCELTSLSSTTLWRLIKKGMFPKSIKISTNRVAWRESDITAWFESKYSNDN